MGENMALKIITDSASDLPKAVTEALEIEVIATPVIINGRDYFDGETIQAKKFMKFCVTEKKRYPLTISIHICS